MAFIFQVFPANSSHHTARTTPPFIMKFSAIFAVVVLAIASVGAVPRDTNALRLARGLTPSAPPNLVSRVESGRRPRPSSKPTQCSSGALQCCNSAGSPTTGYTPFLLDVFGVTGLPDDSLVGLSCFAVGSKNTCSSTPLCCTGNTYDGIIATGCTSAS